jgi:hypothetical protein
MMRGLLLKSWRESRWTTLGMSVAIGAVTGLITLVLPDLMGGLNEFMLEVPFIRSMISAMMGIDISTGLTTTMMLSVMWTHPVVLGLIWSHAILQCARYPAGEIDRGTIDILLGWPVSRRAAWHAATLVWFLSGAVVVTSALAGYGLATLGLEAATRPPFARAATAAVNLFALYLAAGALTLVASSLSSRQIHATATGFAVVAGSFLLNFLGPYWPIADAVSFLGLLEYYKPALILRDGGVPLANIVVLTAASALLWLVGMEITARRDIRTT